MRGEQLEGLFKVFLGLCFVALGLGIVRFPGNPDLKFGSSGTSSKRFVLIGGICLLLTGVIQYFQA